MTTKHDAATLACASGCEESPEAALRQMISLADDIIADMRPLDCLGTISMLLARHELSRHLAMICDSFKERTLFYESVKNDER